jgi:hypothetical protein
VRLHLIQGKIALQRWALSLKHSQQRYQPREQRLRHTDERGMVHMSWAILGHFGAYRVREGRSVRLCLIAFRCLEIARHGTTLLR